MRSTLLSVLFVFGLSVGSSHSQERPGPTFGTWSWSQSAFTTEAARKQLLDFCTQEGITHIDQHISIKKEQGAYRLQNSAALASLIADAKKLSITVNALRGERSMFFAANHETATAQLLAILDFDNELPDDSRFAGIKYDVEPYLTKQWKAGGAQREAVIHDYLSFLQAAKQTITAQSPHLKLSVDVPFWWDKPEYVVLFNGHRKPFVHNIQDQVDWIGIMSYRRKSSDVRRLVETELTYAAEIKKPNSVAPGLNAREIKGAERHTTFWGTPPSSFRKVLADLQQGWSTHPNVRHIMLHDYQALSTYLQ